MGRVAITRGYYDFDAEKGKVANTRACSGFHARLSPGLKSAYFVGAKIGQIQSQWKVVAKIG